MADDPEVDRLYQLPLDSFTTERNALAKKLGQPAIKQLAKPSVPAWAVNQLYWKDRRVYERLIKASERLRVEHRRLLAGKPADVREAEKTHREAIRVAGEEIKRILADSGDAASPATMTAVTETLQSLPGADSPGRLARPLRPTGFEALSGVSARPAGAPTLRVVRKSGAESKREAAALEKQREKEERERERLAEKEKREAQAELARTEAAVNRARAALEKAEAAAEKLRAEFNEASKAHHRARLRART
jgi:hypothetical protein